MLAQEAATLSSGTIATLTGERDYTILDTIQAEFVKFCEKMEGIPFESWQHAWKAFAMSTRTNRDHVCAYIDVGYWRKCSPWFPTSDDCKDYLKEHNINWDCIQ